VGLLLAATAWMVDHEGMDGLWICLPMIEGLVVALLYAGAHQGQATQKRSQRQIRELKARINAVGDALEHAQPRNKTVPDISAAIKVGDNWVWVYLHSATTRSQRFSGPSDRLMLPVGAVTQLRLTAAETATFNIIVAHFTEEDGKTHYTTHFTEEEIERLGKSPFFETLSLRSEVRLAPDRGAPVLVDIHISDKVYHTRALDLSASGIAVLLPLSRRDLSAVSSLVRLEIDLPEQDLPFTVKGRIRNIHPQQKGTRAGIALTFERRRGEDKGAHARLSAYIEQRRQELVYGTPEPTRSAPQRAKKSARGR